MHWDYLVFQVSSNKSIKKAASYEEIKRKNQKYTGAPFVGTHYIVSRVRGKMIPGSTPAPRFFVSEFWVCLRVLGLFRTFHAHTTMLNARPTIFCFQVLGLFVTFFWQPFFRGPIFRGSIFRGPFFPGIIFLGDHFSGDHFSRGSFFRDST